MAADDFSTKTIEESALQSDALDEATPGLVVIFSDGRPKCLSVRLDKKPVDVGRVKGDGVFVVEDDRVSRRHTRITRKGDSVRVTDLDSRNGTFVDGKRITDETFSRLPRLLRVGQTLFRFTPDIRPFLRATVETTAEGSSGRRCAARATGSAAPRRAATRCSSRGRAARAKSSRPAPTTPPAASRQGRSSPSTARRSRRAWPSGSSSARARARTQARRRTPRATFRPPIAARSSSTRWPSSTSACSPSCCACSRCARCWRSAPRTEEGRPPGLRGHAQDLRAEVSAGRFREDLYYRVGRPEVRLPSLIDRLEELPRSPPPSSSAPIRGSRRARASSRRAPSAPGRATCASSCARSARRRARPSTPAAPSSTPRISPHRRRRDLDREPPLDAPRSSRARPSRPA